MKPVHIRYIAVDRIKSKWHADIASDWQPARAYIAHLKKKILAGRYIAPIILISEGAFFYIVNGHHRYLAYTECGSETIKAIIIEGTFEDSEPLRRAEVLLKEFDRKTKYRYQFSGHLDRWAAAAEKHTYVNRYRPAFWLPVLDFLSRTKQKWLGRRT